MMINSRIELAVKVNFCLSFIKIKPSISSKNDT